MKPIIGPPLALLRQKKFYAMDTKNLQNANKKNSESKEKKVDGYLLLTWNRHV